MNFKILKCKNCGKNWGDHYWQYCRNWGSLDFFCPEGYELTDLCNFCNKPLSAHYKHYYCHETEAEHFHKKVYTLPDNLFDI